MGGLTTTAEQFPVKLGINASECNNCSGRLDCILFKFLQGGEYHNPDIFIATGKNSMLSHNGKPAEPRSVSRTIELQNLRNITVDYQHTPVGSNEWDFDNATAFEKIRQRYFARFHYISQTLVGRRLQIVLDYGRNLLTDSNQTDEVTLTATCNPIGWNEDEPYEARVKPNKAQHRWSISRKQNI